MVSDSILIGLTGSFGSGCRSLSDVLGQEKFGFTKIRLSDEVRREAEARSLDKNDRDVLQNIGNDLRSKHGNNYLAVKAIERAHELGGKYYIFRGIRNHGEITEFRKLPNFFLIAVDCHTEERWNRLRDKVYKGDRLAFDRNDRRDKGEKVPNGQQVLRCVEEADIVFLNEAHYSAYTIIENLEKRITRIINLVTGRKTDDPEEDETNMTAASSFALRSKCIKRRVGAVLCTSDGSIVSAAYNAFPGTTTPCLEEPGVCFRDQYRKEFTKELIGQFKFCPECGKPVSASNESFKPQCSECGKNFEKFIPPFKALDKCRSLHAEEAIILRSSYLQTRGSTLYTTTFPCLQCAKRILDSKIKRVVYIDPYPEIEAIRLLEEGGVETEKFQGVKAQAYYKLFSSHRENLEKQIKQKLDSVN